MKVLEQEWSADPTQPGRIAVGDFITIEVRLAFWRVPGGSAEEARLVRETEALVVAARDMVRSLLEVERVLKAWHKDRGEWATLREQIRAALAKAGVPTP